MTDSHTNGGIAYRADIDGLRAVAIVPVVFYHAGIAPFGGGFVGVDVFFVISGYLITSFILGQMDGGKFSLRNFYLRRIRRIFPALFVILTFSAVVGWLLLTPHDYSRLGASIFATVFFSSNVLFWLRSGYFDIPLEQQPLLHTWSLGVEEQFYIVFPILLILLYRFLPRGLIGIIFTLCTLSFATNVFTVVSHPQLAFFLAPPRIWELFFGVLLAMGAAAAPRTDWASEVAGIVGVALIGCAVFGFSQDTTFPGFAALLPTAGAAAIIWAGIGRKATVTHVLSHPWAVFVGKISYSWYLWHFPLLAFVSYIFVGGPSLLTRLALIALSSVLAIASWFFVEQPVRKGQWIFGKPEAVFASAAAAIVVFGGFGLLLPLSGGFPSRITSGQEILEGEHDFNPDRSLCLNSVDDTDIAASTLCKFGVNDATARFALWGDSHAESLRAGLDAAAKKTGNAGIFLGTAGCIPELGIERSVGKSVGSGCDRINAAIVEFLSRSAISTVILAGRWGLWVEGTPYKHEAGGRISFADTSGAPLANRVALQVGLERAVKQLSAAGKQIWLIGPIPEIGYDVPRSLYLKTLGLPGSIDIRPTRQEFNDRQAFVLVLLAELAAKYHAQLIWPHEYLCDSHICAVQRDGHSLYVDDQHLTRFAAISMSKIFDPIFAAAGPIDH